MKKRTGWTYMVTPLVTTAGSHSTPCGKEQRRCSGPPCRRSGSSTTARPLDCGAFILGRTRAPARGPTAAPSLRGDHGSPLRGTGRGGGEKKGSWHLLGRGAGEGACNGGAATSSQPRAAAARCSEKRRKRWNGTWEKGAGWTGSGGGVPRRHRRPRWPVAIGGGCRAAQRKGGGRAS